ncbi:restriction endonuclease subunit S [Gemmiger formicilis]|jgi:type I restriction enzyme S subunit|uniref:restriction endonuclease subunit S n=1 Tax=Gemmiger formicilis TaxID=745368 RepID=UPI00351F8209
MREMKDSGIEWVGTIPAHWSTMPNKYVMRKIKVINPTYNGENILSLTVNGVIVRDLEAGGKMPSSFDGYQILYKGNLLMCLFDYDVTPRCIGLIKDSGVSSPAYSQFVLQRGNDAAYFYYYYLMVDHTKALLHRAKNLRHSFTEEQLGAIKVPVPPIAEQERIADFLDSQCSQIDAISADIQKEIETLEQYKRSLVFEAISKGINGEKTANASSDIWKEIPQSWKLVDIKYLFEIVKRMAGREGYNILSVTQKGLKVKDISGNQGQIAENYSGYQFVFPSDYVMNHMDLLTGWIDCSDQFGVTSPDYRVFRLRDKTQNDTEYYKYVMQCCYMCRIFYSLGQGVSTLGRWRLQTSAFMNFKVPVPPLHEQKEIARYLNDKCKEIELSIEQKRKQLELLSSYKKSLIYEYVTGKKEVI